MSTSRRPSKRGIPRFAFVVAAAALLAAGGWYWAQRKAGDGESAYRTTPVERGDIRVAISATGTLSAISTVVVGSQISGQVTQVLADFNDQVSEGQVLARIDPSTYEAQIAQGSAQVAAARASLAQAQAALRNAQLDYERKAGLGERQLVARSDVDLARAARDQARGAVNAARAQITQQGAATQATRINLGRTVIRSPVDGVVLTRTIEPGQTVAASLQAPELFTIAEDLAQMKIELAVDEADIGQVKAGQGVSFTVDAFPERHFRGRVEQVRLSATTTSNVVTYPVVVSVDNSDHTLLPGLTVNAEIEVSKREGVLKVANAALRYKPADGAVATGATAPAVRGGGTGVVEDLAATAAMLDLDATQQAAFDAAAAKLRQRQAARTAAPAAGGRPGVLGGGGARGGAAREGAAPAALQAQLRQRLAQRVEQEFTAFRATLDAARRARWDAAVTALVGARRATLYTLLDGAPHAVIVRVGASDGTSTEIAGDIRAGDLAVTGARAAP